MTGRDNEQRQTGLLDGVRVVDISRVLAGPFATQMLAEMGADVIKVEPPEGDPARGIGPHRKGRSLYFSSLNTNKRGVVLDLTTDAGRRGFDALLATADIMVENLRPEATVKLGLTPDDLLARHPRLVVATISGYARNSERAGDGSFDLIAQAESGIMAVTGEVGGAPVRAGVAISDLAAGLWAALGATAAYAARLRDGKGRHVEVPLLDAAMTLLAYLATGAAETGVDPEPVGSGHPAIVPYRAYATSDGWLVIAVIGDKFWPPLCDALGLSRLGSRPDLRSNPDRVARRNVVDEAVAGALAELTTDEAIARLSGVGVPHARINTILQALSSAYVRSVGMVADVDAPDAGYQVVQGPLRTGLRPRPAPGLGEHTAEVMRTVLGSDDPLLGELLAGL